MSKNLPIQNSSASLEILSPIQVYLNQIARYPLLEPELEYEFAVRHYEKGDVEAAQRLVTANLRLVVKIASAFQRNRQHLLDLIQEGNTGLMMAVKRFNPYKGVKLSTYAAWWIKAYILKYILDNKSQVKLATTADQRKLFYNLHKETEKLLLQYETVTPKLLADNLEVKEKEVIEMQKRLSHSDVSLDAPVGEDKENTRRIDLIDSGEDTIEDEFVQKEIKEKFHHILEKFRGSLKGRDQEIFQRRLLDDPPLTLQEIGDLYGVSRERARQIEARLVRKLKEFALKEF